MPLNNNLQTNSIDLQALRADASEALTYLDAKLATELQVKLEDLLNSSGINKQLFQELTILLAKIKFLRFASLSEPELMDLVTDYLPLCFSIENFDLKDRVGKRIVFIGEIDLQIGFMEKLAKAFESCRYNLGSAGIEVDGRKLEPTIGNWIKAYLLAPSKSSVKTNLDAWAFVQQGIAAKVLNKTEKEILMEILKIYASLKNRVSSYKNLPESDNEAEIFPNFDLYESFPGLVTNYEDPEWAKKHGDILQPSVEDDETPDIGSVGGLVKPEAKSPPYTTVQKFKLPEEFNPTTLPKVTPPIVPAPKNAPVLRAMEEVRRVASDKSQVTSGTQGQDKANTTDTTNRADRTNTVGRMDRNDMVYRPEAAGKVGDILKKNEDEFRPGLRLGDGTQGAGIKNNELGSRNQEKPETLTPTLSSTFAKATADKQGERGTADAKQPINLSRPPSRDRLTTPAQSKQDNDDVYIDRKLEDLEKRVGKNSP